MPLRSFSRVSFAATASAAVLCMVAPTAMAAEQASYGSTSSDSTEADPSTPAVPAEGGAPISDQPAETPPGPDGASASVTCRAGIDWPHVSGTAGVTYTINTHLDGVCPSYPSQHTIEGSLFRSRWYGWEHLASGSISKPGAYKLSLYLNKKCVPGDLYRYRATGRFYALMGSTRWSVSFYNQNPSEIKCVRTAGASS